MLVEISFATPISQLSVKTSHEANLIINHLPTAVCKHRSQTLIVDLLTIS
jgi:hypothetical protein